MSQRAICLVTQAHLGAPQGCPSNGQVCSQICSSPRDWDKWSWTQFMHLQRLGQPGDASELQCPPAGWSGRRQKVLLDGLIGGINCICRTLTHLPEQEQSRPGGSLKPPLGMWGGVPHPSPCLMAVGRSRCWLKPPCPGIYSFPALQMRCVPGAGAVGSGQWLFAAFSYLLLGRWNRVLEQSPVSHRASPRGALPRAPVPPPSLQVAWQAGTCENQFCTRVPGIQQAALLGCK